MNDRLGISQSDAFLPLVKPGSRQPFIGGGAKQEEQWYEGGAGQAHLVGGPAARQAPPNRYDSRGGGWPGDNAGVASANHTTGKRASQVSLRNAADQRGQQEMDFQTNNRNMRARNRQNAKSYGQGLPSQNLQDNEDHSQNSYNQICNLNTLENNFLAAETQEVDQRQSLDQHGSVGSMATGSGTAQLNQRLDQYKQNFTSIKSRMRRQQNSSNHHSNDAMTAASHQSQQNPVNLVRGAHIDELESRNMLTKQELKALKSINKNREMYQMLGKTQTGNAQSYLMGATGFGQSGRGGKRSSLSSSRLKRGDSVRSGRSKRSGGSKGSGGRQFKINETIRSAHSRQSRQNHSVISSGRFKKHGTGQSRINFKAGIRGSAGGVGGAASGAEDNAASDQDGKQLRTFAANAQQAKMNMDWGESQKQVPTQSMLRSSHSVLDEHARKNGDKAIARSGTQGPQDQFAKVDMHSLQNKQDRLFKIRSKNKILGGARGARGLAAARSSEKGTVHGRMLNAQWQASQGQGVGSQRGSDENGYLVENYQAGVGESGRGKQHAQTDADLNAMKPEVSNMENIIGPGGLVSPANRQALSQARISKQFEEKNKKSPHAPEDFTQHRKSQSSGRSPRGRVPPNVGAQVNQASEILQKYGGLSGKLYSSNAPKEAENQKMAKERSPLARLSSDGEYQGYRQQNVGGSNGGSDLVSSQPNQFVQFPPEVTSKGVAPPRAAQGGHQASQSQADLVVYDGEGQNNGLQKLRAEGALLRKEKGSLKQVSKKKRSQQISKMLQGSPPRQDERLAQIKRSSADTFMQFALSQSKTTRNSQKQFDFKQIMPAGMYPQMKMGYLREIAPSQKIEALKKQTQVQATDNSKYKELLQALDLKNAKTNKNLIDLKKKAVQANSDKIELMRDLATYESNYGEAGGLRQTFQQIIASVSATKAKLAMNVNYSNRTEEPGETVDYDENDSPGVENDREKQEMLREAQNEGAHEIEQDDHGQTGMLKDSQINSVLSHLMVLQKVRRDRFQSGKNPLNTHLLQNTKQTDNENEHLGAEGSLGRRSSLMGKHLQQSGGGEGIVAVRKQGSQASSVSVSESKSRRRSRFKQAETSGNFINNADDDIYEAIIVSGVACIVSARNANSFIKGRLTCQASTREFRVDISPTDRKKTSVDVKNEIHRLFFDYSLTNSNKNKIGKEKLTLNTKESIEDANQTRSFLVSLKGGFHRFVNMDIEAVATRHRVKIKVKDQQISAEIADSDVSSFFGVQAFNLRNHKQRMAWLVSKYIQNKLVLVEKSNGKFQILDETEAQNQYQQQIQSRFKSKPFRDRASKRSASDASMLKNQNNRLKTNSRSKQGGPSKHRKPPRSKSLKQVMTNEAKSIIYEPVTFDELPERSPSINKVKLDYFKIQAGIEHLPNGKIFQDQAVNRGRGLGRGADKAELPRDQYVEDLRLMLLRRRFRKQEEGQTDDDDNMLDDHELFYGLKLAKSQKKYGQYKNYKEKQKQLNEQKETEQSVLIAEFFDDFNEKIQLKNRISEKDNKTIKKKYYRQPKIYQNNYIIELQNKRKISEFFRERQETNPDHTILYLFFVEKHEYFLLLGREECEDDNEEGSGDKEGSKKSGELEHEIIDSERESKEEEDDDSPYFVKITLDSWFLSYLEEPGIVEGKEIEGQYEVLMNNKVFKEIIRREIDMMFGGEKPKKNVLPTIPDVEPPVSVSQSSQSLSEPDEKNELGGRPRKDAERKGAQASLALDLQKDLAKMEGEDKNEQQALLTGKDQSKDGGKGQNASESAKQASKQEQIKGEGDQQAAKAANQIKRGEGSANERQREVHDKVDGLSSEVEPQKYPQISQNKMFEMKPQLENKLQGLINNFSQILNFK